MCSHLCHSLAVGFVVVRSSIARGHTQREMAIGQLVHAHYSQSNLCLCPLSTHCIRWPYSLSLLPLLSCLHQCHSSLGEQHQSHLAESRRGTRCCRVCTRRQLWLCTASDASASPSLHKLSNLAEQFARRASCTVECCAHGWRQWSLAWQWLRQ